MRGKKGEEREGGGRNGGRAEGGRAEEGRKAGEGGEKERMGVGASGVSAEGCYSL